MSAVRSAPARAVLVAAVAAAGLLTTACPVHTGTLSPDEPGAGAIPVPACDSTTATLPAGATLSGASGRYALTMHAAAGGSTRGTLWLEPSSRASAAGVAYPLAGAAELRLDVIGAQAPGNIASREAARPGVLVLEYQRAGAAIGMRDILLRLGGDANAATLAGERFDGAYLVLQPRAIWADRFAGSWRSGLSGAAATGWFCATRLGDR